MAHRVALGSGAGVDEYPRLDDLGGRSGSDLVRFVPEGEARILRIVIEETAQPLPVEDPDRLFDLSVGVVERTGSVARKATQTCLFELTQAPSRFYEGHISLANIIANIRRLACLAVAENEKAYGISECKKSCILAELGRCPFAIPDFEIPDPAFAELIGIQIRSKRPPKKDPAGVTTFKFFSSRSFSVRPPGMPIPKEEQIEEASAFKHVCDWWSKHRPKQRYAHKPKDTPKQSVLEF